ncbi:MAG: hypothetical protein IJM59_02340 [Proteobacteria bacterium]|nr:hypothetical protein [Pseudomonadota bacterium]
MHLHISPSVLIFPILLAANACNLLTPEDPPLEPKILNQTDFAWDELDIAVKYEFIQVPRIDCPKIQSELTGSGKCLPKTIPIGSGIECPLEYPAKSLFFSCISGEDAPIVFARLEWSDNAKNIDFSHPFGPCRFAQAGPLAGEPPRYTTDPGYKVCLFEKTPTPGSLRGQEGSERPAGMFIDLSQNTLSMEELNKYITLQFIDAPAAFVMDSRFLNEEERIQALKDVLTIFSFYRRLPATPSMM